jgi:hypothetical protein
MLTVMLESFRSAYPISDGPDLLTEPEATPGALRTAAGGRTFAKGLYRIHTADSASAMLRHLDAAFPDAPPHTMPYGYDWLGRQFCARADEASAPSLMFEPGTAEMLEIPAPFSEIHDHEFVDYGDAALAQGFFTAYIASGGTAPAVGQCVGYKTPLFLGGVDGVQNLELIDMDVYWHLIGQLIRRVQGRPAGTGIESVTGM